MQITAVGTGGEADESDQVLEAWFAEGSDDSSLVMMFQRDLDTEPWAGDPDTDDWFSNSYCITLGSGETVYGGLKQVSFSGTRTIFEFADREAAILHIEQSLVVDFQASEQDLRLFQEMLVKVGTWGVPSQIPQLIGFN